MHQLCSELFAQMYKQVSSTTVSNSTVLLWVQPANWGERRDYLGLQQQLCSWEIGSQDHTVIQAGRGLRRYNQLLWGKSLGHTCFVHQRTQNTVLITLDTTWLQYSTMWCRDKKKFSLRSGSKKASSPSTSLRNLEFFLGGSVNLVHCGSDGNALLLNTESLLLSLYSIPAVPIYPYLSALPLPNNNVFQTAPRTKFNLLTASSPPERRLL